MQYSVQRGFYTQEQATLVLSAASATVLEGSRARALADNQSMNNLCLPLVKMFNLCAVVDVNRLSATARQQANQGPSRASMARRADERLPIAIIAQGL